MRILHKHKSPARKPRKTRRSKRPEPKLIGSGPAWQGKGFDNNVVVQLYRIYKVNNKVSELWPEGALSKGNVANILIEILHENVGTKYDVPCLSSLSTIIEMFVRCHRAQEYQALVKQYLYTDVITMAPKTALPPINGLTIMRFLEDVLKRVVPRELLGTERNQLLFVQIVKRIVFSSLSETVTLGSMMHGFKLCKIPWLNSVCGSALQRHIMAKVLMWLLHKYVLVLIRSHFYVTEMSNVEKKLVYYWQRHWQQFSATNLTAMKAAGNLIPLQPADASFMHFAPTSIGVSSLHLLPKNDGKARLIITKVKSTRLTGNMMWLLHQLKTEPPQDLHQKWVNIWSKLNNVPLYFVRADISDAYGSVDLQKLTHIFYGILNKDKPDSYFIAFYHVNKTSSGGPKMRVVRKLVDSMAQGRREAGERVKIRKKDLFRNVISMTVDNRVSIGYTTYQVNKGLVQGNTLSSILSEFYYSDMDTKCLAEFKGAEDTLIRKVDDYLYITPCRKRAQRFLAILNTGFPEYSCFFNPAKTVTNLREGVDHVSFFGFVMDTRTLGVRGDYSPGDMRYVTMLNCTSKPGKFLLHRWGQALSLRLHPILLDKRFNSTLEVRRNLFLAILLGAFQCNALLQHATTVVNPGFLIKLLRNCTRILDRRLAIMNMQFPPEFSLCANEGRWLLCQAYHHMMSQYKETYNIASRGRLKMEQSCINLSQSTVSELQVVTLTLPPKFANIK